MDQIIKVNFEECQDVARVNEGLVAWNYGQVLQVEGLTIPNGTVEVHFSLTDREGDANVYIGTVIDNVITVDIPDFIFQKQNVFQPTYVAYAFVYQTDEESGRTIKKIVFTINVRPEPTTSVPEDQKDPFLEEVRKVMAETKDIAQSVRNDADNGVFNGEQGPKGDAGSIQFKIVPTLPTEDIDTSIMYLVPSPTEEDENRYLEYVYIDGKPEIVGSASVQVNPDEFVKKDDYASETNAGLIKITKSYGFLIDNNGYLTTDTPNDNEINNKTGNQMLKVSQIDKIVKSGLVNCKEEWTDEQKQLARELLGAIGANNVDAQNGLAVLANGQLIISPATKALLDKRTDGITDTQLQRKPITLAILDYAVKKALSDCKLEGDDVWTEEEKAKALELLGGVKAPKTPKYSSVLYMGYDGGFGTIRYSDYPIEHTIATRTSRGTVATNTPTEDNDAATKKYVDDLVGSVESILTELHTYAQTKIGGEA